jgi:hypothetical protein
MDSRWAHNILSQLNNVLSARVEDLLIMQAHPLVW